MSSNSFNVMSGAAVSWPLSQKVTLSPAVQQKLLDFINDCARRGIRLFGQEITPSPCLNDRVTKDVVESAEVPVASGNVPLYFKELDSLWGHLGACMTTNAADALTRTQTEQDGLSAARDLCR